MNAFSICKVFTLNSSAHTYNYQTYLTALQCNDVFKFARYAKMLSAFRATQFTCYSGVYAYITSDYSRVSLRCFDVFHAPCIIFTRYIYPLMIRSTEKKREINNSNVTLDSPLIGTFH